MIRGALSVAAAVVLLLGCADAEDRGAGEVGAADSAPDSIGVVRGDSFVSNVRAAVEAVEATLGGPQQYFEVTATPQLTNVFVAVDVATAAVPYVFIDGVLEAPGPTISGVEGFTFDAQAVDFDDSVVLSGIEADLPTGIVDSFSVEGGAGGFARYVVAVRSAQGGVLDIVVAPNGAIIEVVTL